MQRVCAALLLSWALLLGAPTLHAQSHADERTVRQAIESVLELDAGRDTRRLPRVTLDEASGDLTVVFAMRRPLVNDPRQIVNSATDDVLTILWATYASPAAGRVRTATVLGTYAVVGRYQRPREIPLLRAVLSADRAAQLDWTQFSTMDPGQSFDVWWLEGELPR
jgi:hypothetical protein